MARKGASTQPNPSKFRYRYLHSALFRAVSSSHTFSSKLTLLHTSFTISALQLFLSALISQRMPTHLCCKFFYFVWLEQIPICYSLFSIVKKNFSRNFPFHVIGYWLSKWRLLLFSFPTFWQVERVKSKSYRTLGVNKCRIN